MMVVAVRRELVQKEILFFSHEPLGVTIWVSNVKTGVLLAGVSTSFFKQRLETLVRVQKWPILQ